MLIDAGAEFNGYAADITRTHGVRGRRLRLAYNVDGPLQQQHLRRGEPGVDFAVLDAFTHRQIASVLREHNLVTCSADEAVATSITHGFLPHGLGHLLGLQVHDAGGHPFDPRDRARNERREAGPVPAIDAHAATWGRRHDRAWLYFIPALLTPLLQKHRVEAAERASIERLVPFGGIRIEDTSRSRLTAIKQS